MGYEELVEEFEQKLNRELLETEKVFVNWLFQELQKDFHWFKRRERFC